VKSIRKSIKGIGVVERLSTESGEKVGATLQRGAVINVGVGLYNPDKLLARVVKVKLDLVGRRTNRLVASELKLLNKVLVGVLCHAAALVGVEEDVIHVKRSSDKRLVVGGTNLHDAAGAAAVKTSYGPEALVNGTEIKVDLYLVVLQGNKRKGETRVAAVPELKRNVEGRLRESVARGAYGVRCRGVARTIHIGEERISDESKLSRVTDHLVVAFLLVASEGQLLPDVHPITILAIYALATDLNLYL
jgi:hypothetical protein